MTVVVGIDLGIGDELDAEAILTALHAELAADWPGLWIGTYAVSAPGGRHAAFAVELPMESPPDEALALETVSSALTRALAHHAHDGDRWHTAILVVGTTATADEDQAAGARAAIAAHRTRESGRLVVYPGVERLVAEVTAGDIRATAIDDLVSLCGRPVGDDTVVITRDFVRPRWAAGRLVLHVQPGPGGCLVPFEEPYPHRCCAAH